MKTAFAVSVPLMMGFDSTTGEGSTLVTQEAENGSAYGRTVAVASEIVSECSKTRELSFVSRLNNTTGKMEWVEMPEDYDYHQEIARSAFADMLHDHDRNMRYFQALRYEIAKLKSKGEVVNVLDIGTGTGLLSMMAVIAGADNVFACDAFTPMLECARKVVRRNGFHDRIKLIPKRSTELVVGVDIPCRCNLLVTEVFDTELIGEGAICTFNHAHEELLTPDSVVIPSASTVYAQVVDCADVEKWNSLPEELKISDVRIKFPANVSRCPGVPSCQDLQLDAIQPEEFKALSPPLPIFKFDFTSSTGIPYNRKSEVKFEAEWNGSANAVFLWWDLDMDTSGDNVLTCQPSYVSKGPESWFKDCLPQTPAWRDHWMHSVYYIPRKETFGVGGDGVLRSAHDEYSFWFDVECGRDNVELCSSHPICECGVHTVLSRSQVYMMNGVGRYEALLETFRGKVVVGESVCLCLSDCSLVPIMLAKIGAKRVFVVERCRENAEFSRRIAEENCVRDVVVVLEKEVEEIKRDDLEGMKVDLITGDPYFHGATYPWNNLLFWYLKNSIHKDLLSDSLRITPYKAVLRGVACKFTHLWKINAPVGVAAGEFNLVDFDNLIRDSTSIADSPVDAQPLWEYETFAASPATTLMEFDLTNQPVRQENKSAIIVPVSNQTNGIAIWVDWHLTDDVIVSTGPKTEIKPGEIVNWERFSKQGVYFLEDRVRDEVSFHVCFNESDGEICFNFG